MKVKSSIETRLVKTQPNNKLWSTIFQRCCMIYLFIYTVYLSRHFSKMPCSLGHSGPFPLNLTRYRGKPAQAKAAPAAQPRCALRETRPPPYHRLRRSSPAPPRLPPIESPCEPRGGSCGACSLADWPVATERQPGAENARSG